jgi:hypothetical protein
MIIQMGELYGIGICDTQAFGNGDGGSGCHHHCCTYMVLKYKK